MRPRSECTQWLAEHGITTGIDVSDGLAADVAHLCEASGVGACIEAELLPIQPEVALIAMLAGPGPTGRGDPNKHATRLAGSAGVGAALLALAEIADALRQRPGDADKPSG